MSPIWFCVFWVSFQQPMNVLPGDPIIDVDARDLDGQTDALPDLLDTSLCWVLSVGCDKCLEAYRHINELYVDQFHTVLLFLDEADEVDRFIRRNPTTALVRLVTHEQLKPYRIEKVPALLLYKESRLAYAFYGPLTAERAHKMNAWFHDHLGL